MLSFQHFPLLSVLNNLLKTLALPVRVLCKSKTFTSCSFTSLQPGINKHWCQEGQSCPPFCLSPPAYPLIRAHPLIRAPFPHASISVRAAMQWTESENWSSWKITDPPTTGEPTAKLVPWANLPCGYMNPSARTWAAGAERNDPFCSKINLCQTELIVKL